MWAVQNVRVLTSVMSSYEFMTYEVLLHCAAVEAAEDDMLIAEPRRANHRRSRSQCIVLASMCIVLNGQMTVYCDYKLFELVHITLVRKGLRRAALMFLVVRVMVTVKAMMCSHC